jgi:hypothetical protein
MNLLLDNLFYLLGSLCVLSLVRVRREEAYKAAVQCQDLGLDSVRTCAGSYFQHFGQKTNIIVNISVSKDARHKSRI